MTGLCCVYLLAVLCVTATAGAAVRTDVIASPSRAPRQSLAAAAAASAAVAPRPADGGASVRIADGAYPVYYSVARSNGRFGKRIRAYGIGEYDQMKHDGMSAPVQVPVVATTQQPAAADIRQ